MTDGEQWWKEKRQDFKCNCGEGYQYLCTKDGLKIICTRCNLVKDANRSVDKIYIREWIGNG